MHVFTIHGVHFFGHLVKLVAETSPLPRGLTVLFLALLAWGMVFLVGLASWVLFWHVSARIFGGFDPLG